MSVSSAARSIALTMSITASPATLTAVSASISTPVRPVVRTVAVISTPSSTTSVSTSTPVMGSGWQSGIRSGVFFDALDAGDPGHGQRVALGHGAVPQRGDAGRAEPDPAAGGRLAYGLRLGRHVDHPRVAGGVEVREVGLGHARRQLCGSSSSQASTWPPGGHQLGLLGQHDQRVGPGQVAQQVRAVAADQLDLPPAVGGLGDHPPGQLGPAGDGGDRRPWSGS